MHFSRRQAHLQQSIFLNFPSSEIGLWPCDIELCLLVMVAYPVSRLHHIWSLFGFPILNKLKTHTGIDKRTDWQTNRVETDGRVQRFTRPVRGDRVIILSILVNGVDMIMIHDCCSELFVIVRTYWPLDRWTAVYTGCTLMTATFMSTVTWRLKEEVGWWVKRNFFHRFLPYVTGSVS